jgi:uncharacterized integral membrane protein
MTQADGAPTKGRGLDTRRVLVVVAVVLLAWFAIANSQSISVHFWITSTRAPVVVVVVIAAALGGLVGWFARGRRRQPRSPES